MVALAQYSVVVFLGKPSHPNSLVLQAGLSKLSEQMIQVKCYTEIGARGRVEMALHPIPRGNTIKLLLLLHIIEMNENECQ